MRRLIRRQPIPRAARRIPLDRPATLRFAETGEVITSSQGNISIDGAFIATKNVKPPGTVFQFECDLAYTKIEGLVEVVWFREEDQGPDHPAGLGLQFVELSPESRKLIYRLIDGYIKQGGTPDMGQIPTEEEPPEAAAPAAHTTEETGSAGFYLPDESAGVPEAWEARGSQRVRKSWLLPLLLVLVLAVAFYMAPDRFLSLLPFGDGEPTSPSTAPVQEAAEPTATTPPQPSAPPAPETATTVEPEAREEPVEAQQEPAVEVEVSPQPSLTPPDVTSTAPPVAEVEPPPQTIDESSSQTPAPLSRIVALDWQRVGSQLLVVIEADANFTSSSYSTLRMDQGRPREVVRIYGVDQPYQDTALAVGEPELRRIRSGYHVKPEGNELHFVLDLSGPAVRLTRVEEAGSRLLIYLGR